jgi:hypothetical protein
MSTVLLAVFRDYETADRVRVMLVQDGFPTDRVDLTAACELGRAGLEPADSPHDKCVEYFSTLLVREDELPHRKALAQRIQNGEATVVVHPRGALETARATELLQEAHPTQILGHDLASHGWDHAASNQSGHWMRHLWLESSPGADCIYCRMFPVRPHTH